MIFLLNKGKINLDGFTSTCACYNDFLGDWSSPSQIIKEDGAYIPDTYFLRIIVPEATPFLDCNAKYENMGTRLKEEVIFTEEFCENYAKNYVNALKEYTEKLGLERIISLEKALDYAGIAFEGHMHDALCDAKNTAELFAIVRNEERCNEISFQYYGVVF